MSLVALVSMVTSCCTASVRAARTAWRQGHLDVEHRLKTRGLLLSENGPHHARLSDEVHDGLDRVFVRPGY